MPQLVKHPYLYGEVEGLRVLVTGGCRLQQVPQRLYKKINKKLYETLVFSSQSRSFLQINGNQHISHKFCQIKNY